MKTPKKPEYAGVYSLDDTMKLMVSTDYKERFIAEYVQLKIRAERLNLFIIDAKLGKEEHTCPISLLESQLSLQETLLNILETRASMEDIDLRYVSIKIR